MRSFWPLLATMLILAAPVAAQDELPAPPARTPELASADAVELQSLSARHQDKFEGVYGNVSVSGTSVKGTIALCKEHLARIEMLETEVLPELEPVLARITETWGPPPDENEGDVDAAQHAMNIGGDIEWNMKMAASGNDVRTARDLPEQFDHLSNRYSDLVRMLNDVQKTRVADAEYLSTFVQNNYSPSTIDFVTEDVRVPKLKEAKTLLGFAVRFDPSNEFANDRLAGIDAEIDAMAKAGRQRRGRARPGRGRAHVPAQPSQLGEERERHRGACGLRAGRLGARGAGHLRPHHQLGPARARGGDQARVARTEPRPRLRTDPHHPGGGAVASSEGPALRQVLGGEQLVHAARQSSLGPVNGS
jgi:hypothetical protein